MRIAITGGTGLLGRYFIELLAQESTYLPVILSRQNCYLGSSVEMRTTYYSVSSLNEVLSDIDAVVHLAAQRGTATNLSYFEDNLHITQNIYDACVKTNIKNVVNASTIVVYSNNSSLPWDERDIPDPQTFYGVSKICSEYIGNLYSREHGINVKNLRFPPIFGCVDDNNITRDRMISKFMRQAFNKEVLVLYSNQSAKREFIYAKDAALALLYAVNYEAKAGTFNIGNGEALTNQEVAEQINKAFENTGNIIVKDIEEKQIQSSYMTSDKACMELGFEAKYSFYEAVKEIYREMQNV